MNGFLSLVNKVVVVFCLHKELVTVIKTHFSETH